MSPQPETANLHDPRLAWYLEAKFGLFIHWGAYAAAGAEASWSMMAPDLARLMFGTSTTLSEAEYTALAGRFNPTKFDAKAWVRAARQAGMRYMVLTSKHHDGFCMFDAPGTEYKITNTPFGRDVCQELAEACAQAGMPLGFYYSPPDMHHPGYRDMSKPVQSNWVGEPKRKEWSEYLDYMESHVRHLLTHYGKVAVMWFDGLTNHLKYDPPRFHRLVHELSPETLINDRLGDGYDFITPEQFIPKGGIPARTGKPPSGEDPGGDALFKMVSGGFKLPGVRGWLEKQLQKYANGELVLTPVFQEEYPPAERFQPWETCMTMGKTWAYNPQESDWKTPTQLIRNLCSVAGGGGNYLLNVGPTAEGTFPPEALERLEAIGRWLEVHGEAIYGSTYTPIRPAWGAATRRGSKLFMHVFEPPQDRRLEIESFPGKAGAVRMQGGKPLPFQQETGRLEVELPQQTGGAGVTVVEVEIDPAEAGWKTFSPAKPTRKTVGKYLREQALTSAWINALINGLLAACSYIGRPNVPAAEGAVDVPITAFILGFLVSWIMVGFVRGEIRKGNLAVEGMRRLLPRSGALSAVLLALACVLIPGGLLSGGLLLLAPGGLPGWGYFLFKTFYTGLTAATAVAYSVLAVAGKQSK